MDIVGMSQSGQNLDRLSLVVGTIMDIRGPLRISFLLPDGTPVYTERPDGPVQYAESLSYDVMVELPSGQTYVEKCKPVNQQWPSPLKVRIPQVGEKVFGWQIGDQFDLWILPMPDFGPCDTAPPPAGAAAASVPVPAGPPPRETPGEVPYDPSQDPIIVDNSKGYTSGPETDSLGPTSGDA